MWLPEPVYESLPYVYLAIGTAFMGGAIYLGIGHAPAAYYVGLGIFSLLAGVVIHLRRSTARKAKDESGLSDAD
jgi:hypothetical protein